MRQGDSDACQNIGLIYVNSKGVPKDRAKGDEYFEKACDDRSWLSYKNIAILYLNRLDDKSKAAQYFKKASELAKDSLDVRILPIGNESWQKACDMYNALR